MFEIPIKALVTELSGTAEYQALKQAKANLDNKPDLKTRVEQFWTAETATYEPPPLDKARSGQLASLMRVPDIAAFLTAGQRLNFLLAQLYQSIDQLLEQELAKKN